MGRETKILTSVSIQPIGIFSCSKSQPFSAARQGSVDRSSEFGHIQLNPGFDFEQALTGLQEFSHIWLLYQFHNNSHWKPMVLPPRGTESRLEKKVGVLASRSPYRPNPIGLSCVRLEKVEGRQLWVSAFDLLDATPIIDIKPYLTYADSFPEASLGWVDPKPFAIELSAQAQQQIEFLRVHGLPEIQNFILNQLEYDPCNCKKKRVKPNPQGWTLAYRTWRIDFSKQSNSSLCVLEIRSGYSAEELSQTADPYLDKPLHLQFIASIATRS